MRQETKKSDSRRKRRKWFIGASLFLPVVLTVIFLSYVLGGFIDHLNRFNLAAEAKDSDLAEQEFAALEHYYNLAEKWGVQGLADKYVYKNTFLRKAILAFLIDDFGSVIKDETLQSNLDNHLVSQLVGSAKFRQAKAKYQEAKTKDEKERIINMVMEDACGDFKRAVENGPGASDYFDHSYNFDLCSERQATKKALEGPGPPKIKLSFEQEAQPRSGKDGKKDMQNSPTRPGGGSSLRKKG